MPRKVLGHVDIVLLWRSVWWCKRAGVNTVGCEGARRRSRQKEQAVRGLLFHIASFVFSSFILTPLLSSPRSSLPTALLRDRIGRSAHQSPPPTEAPQHHIHTHSLSHPSFIFSPALHPSSPLIASTTMATVDPLQQTVAALNALYNSPSNSAKKEANVWLESFQTKVSSPCRSCLCRS